MWRAEVRFHLRKKFSIKSIYCDKIKVALLKVDDGQFICFGPFPQEKVYGFGMQSYQVALVIWFFSITYVDIITVCSFDIMNIVPKYIREMWLYNCVSLPVSLLLSCYQYPITKFDKYQTLFSQTMQYLFIFDNHCPQTKLKA